MKMHARDVVIVGSGPAGCAAALYAARSELETLVLEQASFGGQIISSSLVENYPGVPATDGYTLMESMRAQAESAGAQFMVAEVYRVQTFDQGFLVTTGNEKVAARSVIACLGSDPREAGFVGERRYKGRGVSYCAVCDAMFYRNKLVFVCGGGNSAAEEALMLADFAKEVILLVRKPSMRAEESLIRRLEQRENVQIRYEAQIMGIDGGDLPSSIQFKDLRTGELTTQNYEEGSFGVFVYVGREPNTASVHALVDLDPTGHVLTDERMQTRTLGLFVAGDCRSKAVRQIVTAVSDGAIAALSAADHLRG